MGKEASFIPLISALLGVFLILALFYTIGAFFSGKRSNALQDAVLTRIPVVRTIYGVARQVTEAISSPMGHHFSRVVFVEWPRPGVGAMGFVTGHLGGGVQGEEPLVAVYIPTVPNPTSGMLAFFSEEDVTETNITVQEAMKTIFSGGLVLPDMPARVVPAMSHKAAERSKASPQLGEESLPATADFAAQQTSEGTAVSSQRIEDARVSSPVSRES